MSHFTVLVISGPGDPPIFEDLYEGAMAPYMENCCDTPDKKFMKFFDVEDEYREEYDKGTVEMVVMPDGRLLHPTDEEFRVEGSIGIALSMGTHKVPDNLEKREVPFKELYPNFEEFVKEWHGPTERDEEMGRFGYWQNENRKWDWFEIGGRWAGFFKLKYGKTGYRGAQYGSIKGGTEENAKGRADQARKGDIDFETMRRQAEERAAKVYDAVQKAVEHTPVNESWEEVRAPYLETKMAAAGNKPGEPVAEGGIDRAREVYHAQPRVKAFREFTSSEEGREMVGFMAAVDSFNVPREQYLRSARDGACVTHAVVKDGKWYESGEMGWWGIVDAEKDEETWNSMFSKLLDDLPDDTILTVCDCHI